MLPFGIASHCIGFMFLAGSAPTGEIGGVVRDADGQPVRRAVVMAVNQATGWIGWTTCENAHENYGSDNVWAESSEWYGSEARTGAARTKTDRDGHFSLKDLREGDFLLLAAHPEKGMLIVKDVKPDDGQDPLTLKLPPPSFVEGKINGYKKGKTGFWQRAYESARLYLVGDPLFSRLSPNDANGKPLVWFNPLSEIGADGTFRIGPLPSGGKMNLRIERWDGKLFQETVLIAVTLDVVEGKTTRFDYDLTSHQTVGGTLVDENGKPVAGAAVQLHFTINEDEYLGVLKLGAVTDAKGRFVVRGVPPGTYTLSAHRMGGRSTAAQLGTACETVQMEFKAEQVLVLNTDDSPGISIKLTRADRERARVINRKREGIREEADETIPPDKWFEPAVAPE